MVEAAREREEPEGEDAWSDANSEAEMTEFMKVDLSDQAPGTGKGEYLARCAQLKIVPVAMFIAKLECAQINLRHHGIGVKGSYAVAAALQQNTHIRFLNLGDNWLGDEGAAAVAAVLGPNKTLTSLNLAENRIGVYGARALCDGILKTTTLKELVLRGNGYALLLGNPQCVRGTLVAILHIPTITFPFPITYLRLDDRSAAPLFDAIGQSSTLTRVDLSSNALGDETGRLAAAALVNNNYLVDLHLGWNSLRAKGGAAIAEALKSNRRDLLKPPPRARTIIRPLPTSLTKTCWAYPPQDPDIPGECARFSAYAHKPPPTLSSPCSQRALQAQPELQRHLRRRCAGPGRGTGGEQRLNQPGHFAQPDRLRGGAGAGGGAGGKPIARVVRDVEQSHGGGGWPQDIAARGAGEQCAAPRPRGGGGRGLGGFCF
jgi:hypothetical protein